MIPCCLVVVLTIITFNLQASQVLGKRQITYDFVDTEPELKRACLASSKKTAFATKNTNNTLHQRLELHSSPLSHLCVADVLSRFTDIHVQEFMAKKCDQLGNKFNLFFSLNSYAHKDIKNFAVMVHRALKKAHTEIIQYPQAVADILWKLMRSAALKKHDEYTENALLKAYERIFGYCDIFAIKNDKNQKLLEYATTLGCPLITKTLLQFNADIKNAVLERATTISDQEIVEIKERCQNPGITDLLTNVYHSRRSSCAQLRKNYISFNRLQYHIYNNQG
ncbi:hypothetical protein Noda2021_09760 [Candidatus Dependentiae bacterium Noda2021]|nr:hypothetical protein Noda2021_09760 [Candidatus Dependentiae bacterium Noda2021]